MGLPLLRLGLVIAAVGAMYAASLSGYFVSDDVFYVQMAARLAESSPGELVESLLASAGDASGTRFYRPLTFASFVQDYRVSGVDPLGYRVTSAVLHVANALVLGALVRFLVHDAWAGLLAALLFALHPANPESVAWVSARADPLVGLFILLGTLCFVRRVEGRKGYVALTALAAALAFASKEPAVMLVPTLAVLVFLRGDGPPAARARRAFAETWWLWAVLAGYFAVRLAVLGTLVGGHHYVRADPWTADFWSERLNTVGVLLAPVHLEVLAVPWKPGVLALVVGIATAGWFAVRRDALLRCGYLFAGAWTCLALVPTFQMDIDAINLFGSRVLYEASAALAVLLSVGALGIARRTSTRVALPVAVLLLGAYAVLTHAHLRFWIEAGRLSRALHREMGMGPLELAPAHQGMLVEVFHGAGGVLGAARDGQFAALLLVERRIAAAAGARRLTGDESARGALVECLLSSDRATRVAAIDALEEKYGERRGYDPDAPARHRAEAAARWR